MRPMITFVFLTNLFFISFCFGDVATPPVKIYGDWEVYRTADVGGSLTDAKKAMGKKVHFDNNQLQYDQSFLGFPKDVIKNVVYEWKKVNLYGQSDDIDHLALSRHGPLDEESSPDAYLLKISSEKDHYIDYFELTKKGELAFYFDGHIYFLKKLSSNENTESGGFWEWIKRLFK